MAYDFDIRSVIKAILGKILPAKISLVFYTELKFVYNCFVKLNITYKKRFTINIMSIC